MGAMTIIGLVEDFVDMIKRAISTHLFNSINLPPVKKRSCQKFSFNL